MGFPRTSSRPLTSRGGDGVVDSGSGSCAHKVSYIFAKLKTGRTGPLNSNFANPSRPWLRAVPQFCARKINRNVAKLLTLLALRPCPISIHFAGEEVLPLPFSLFGFAIEFDV